MAGVSVGSKPIDELLGGGLESDAVTLLFGAGGTGKTNIALVAAREVARTGKRVVYIDTEGVSPQRLDQLFKEDETALSHIMFYHALDLEEQEKIVRTASRMPKLGLIVVDSFNVHYRLHMEEEDGQKKGGRILFQMIHALASVARANQTPILITGQVYGGEESVSAFGGKTLDHMVKTMLRLEKLGANRVATLIKHRAQPEGLQANYRIEEGGVAAVSAPAKRTERKRADPEPDGFQPASELDLP